MKVFVTFGCLSWQKGGAAQLVSFAAVARSIRPDVEITLESHAFDLDAGAARELGINLVGHPGSGRRSAHEGSLRLLAVHLQLVAWAMLKRIGLNCRPLVRNATAHALLEADMVADFSGDSYRDRPGGFALAHDFFLLSALWCGKPVSIVSQSLGPFKWYSRVVTRYCLNRIDHIYTREPRTSDLLRSIGVEACRITLAPDVAFCLPAASFAEARQFLPQTFEETLARDGAPVVGISVSCLMHSLSTRGHHNYIEKMAQVIRFISKEYGALVLLVPHVVSPPAWGRDDAGVARELAEMVADDHGVFVVTGDPSASALKAVISRCDVFLGARMHAAIAALSSNVPTIVLSWSHKYAGVMREIGLERFVWNMESTGDELERLVQEMWDAREDIRDKLRQYNAAAQRAVRAEVCRVLETAHVGALSGAAIGPVIPSAR